MTTRLIVNIRGPNASGKTTLASHFKGEPEFVLGSFPDAAGKRTAVKAQTKSMPGLCLPVHLIGTYDGSKYSGCDKVKSKDVIHGAIRAAVASLEGHVMFEGFYVSKSWEPYAALRNEIVRSMSEARGQSFLWLWVLMHMSQELMMERIKLRSPDREPNTEELAGAWRQMNNSRVKALGAFSRDVVLMDPAQSPSVLYARLLSFMVTAESGS